MFGTRRVKAEMSGEHDALFKEARAITEQEILVGKRSKILPITPTVKRRLDRAIELFSRVVEINPVNRAPEALSSFERALVIKPSQTAISREASICAMELGDHGRAIMFATSASQSQPYDAGLQSNLALAYLLAGRVADSEIAVERALSLDSRDSVSNTVSAMVKHFRSTGEQPPGASTDLAKYWRDRHLNTS